MKKIKINIKGKRIENFIKRLIDNDIELYNVEYISYQEIDVIINMDDYKKVKKIKTIYKIFIKKKYGFLRLKELVKENIIIISSIIIGTFLLGILSNIVFSIEVIHNNKEIREIIYKELENNDIKIHKFKKSKKEIDRIKKIIQDSYKDKIEWLEIESIGTSYIIKVQERIINIIENDTTKRNIVAKKNAVILDIDAIKGNIEKQRGEYVKKGDVIIGGTIKLNDDIKDIVHAEGNIYGEVWYILNVDYPYVYQEERYTKKEYSALTLNFINRKFILFDKKYKYNKITEIKKINSIIPIYLSINKYKEIEKTDYILTCDQASSKAIDKGISQIKKRLSGIEHIIDSKILKQTCNDSNASLEIFYSVYENITDYQLID